MGFYRFRAFIKKGGKSMGRDKRQRQILEKLCHRRHDTYSNLAQEFHVSERTIMRDVQGLMLEYPLHTSRGKYGGVWVDNGFYLYRKFLSAEQREALTRVLDQAPLRETDLEQVKSILVQFSP